MTSEKRSLLGELARYAYQYRPDNPFKLVSGQTSPEYLDCKLALSQPRAMAALGPVILRELVSDVVAIGGLTMGADPIAISACQASFETTHMVRWFSVRKDPKTHGQRKLIEGNVECGEKVAIVDDVVTTGKSTIQAIEKCREFGLQVSQVIVLVDREQSSGLSSIKKAAGNDIPVTAIFKKQEIVDEWHQQNAKHEPKIVNS